MRLHSFLFICLLAGIIGGALLARPAQACPLGDRGCGHPCCVEVEYFWKNGRWQCKCSEWDYVCLGQGQPPALDAELVCAAWGSSGWCAGEEILDLTATDPHGGEVMLSGDLNGEPFACPASVGATTCAVPLPEGAGVVNYTALAASTALTSGGSTAYRRDSLPPQIDGLLDGIPGQNGWYVSAVDVSASASDPEPGSAVAAFDYILDGGLQTPWPGGLTLTDGMHTLLLRAVDNAGNLAEITQTVNVDTLTPELSLSLNGVPGNGGWYLSPLEIIAAAGDSGSGLAGEKSRWTVLDMSITNRRSLSRMACTSTNFAPPTMPVT